MKALQQFLRPEFINRVDAVITFNRLSEENFHGIARINAERLVVPEGERHHLHLRRRTGGAFDEEVLLPDLRARNLRRTIQKELEDPMATQIIDSYENPVTQIRATAENDAVKLYCL